MYHSFVVEISSSVMFKASAPCIHLLSISRAALGWSIGTMCPASCILRKARGPWLFSCPASVPSTVNDTVGALVNSFCPDHSIACTHLEFPSQLHIRSYSPA
uniref:Uncharacterized protein n=1 Tax=Opuntia streptacantha TaxID=393608 RepID=A0A7C9A286_OPUST